DREHNALALVIGVARLRPTADERVARRDALTGADGDAEHCAHLRRCQQRARVGRGGGRTSSDCGRNNECEANNYKTKTGVQTHDAVLLTDFECIAFHRSGVSKKSTTPVSSEYSAPTTRKPFVNRRCSRTDDP